MKPFEEVAKEIRRKVARCVINNQSSFPCDCEESIIAALHQVRLDTLDEAAKENSELKKKVEELQTELNTIKGTLGWINFTELESKAERYKKVLDIISKFSTDYFEEELIGVLQDAIKIAADALKED